MTRYLILLLLTRACEDLSFSIEGVWNDIAKRVGDEWKFERAEFNAEIIAMLEDGLLDVSHGSVTLRPSGKAELRDSKLITFICESMAIVKS